MCLGRMLSSSADVLGALEIAILGSRGEKKKSFYQSHRKHCHGSVGWAGFCPKSLACLQNRAGKNKGKGSAAQPDQLLGVKAKSFMGKGSGCFTRGGGERAFPQIMRIICAGSRVLGSAAASVALSCRSR